MGYVYRFKHSDHVTMISGKYAGFVGVVESRVFQRTVDFPEEYSLGYHVVLDTRPLFTEWWEQLEVI